MDILRNRVKMLKVMQGITYREIAEYLELQPKSFYNWLNGQYEFGEDTKYRLKEILDNLEE